MILWHPHYEHPDGFEELRRERADLMAEIESDIDRPDDVTLPTR